MEWWQTKYMSNSDNRLFVIIHFRIYLSSHHFSNMYVQWCKWTRQDCTFPNSLHFHSSARQPEAGNSRRDRSEIIVQCSKSSQSIRLKRTELFTASPTLSLITENSAESQDLFKLKYISQIMNLEYWLQF